MNTGSINSALDRGCFRCERMTYTLCLEEEAVKNLGTVESLLDAWLTKRRDNAKRIAEGKRGDDRVSWLTDAALFELCRTTLADFSGRLRMADFDLELSFKGYENVLEWLKRTAAENFRTVDQQVLYVLHQMASAGKVV